MNNSNKFFFKSILVFTFFIVTSCITHRKYNNIPSNGIISNLCDAQGELAMMAAPVVIEQSNTSSCGNNFASIWTAIVLKDDYHSLANICDDKLFLELYYSRNSSSLDNLQTLASNSSGANFVLPNDVGRLVQINSLPETRLQNDRRFYIEQFNRYDPNRLTSKVQLPYFLANYNDRNLNVIRFQNGQTIFYKWAKRIIAQSGLGDPLTVSKKTYSYVSTRPNSVSAGEDITITLPEERIVTLNGSVVNNNSSITSTRWTWRRQNFGPEIDPTINNPNSPITDVVFNDYGNHDFELKATDNCGKTFIDTVRVFVRGQLNPSPPRNCSISSGESCSNGRGSNFYIRNFSNTTTRVTYKITTDLRSWQDTNTSGHGTIVEYEFTITLVPNQENYLGCSVTLGSGSNGSDIAYNSWTIVNEIPQ